MLHHSDLQNLDFSDVAIDVGFVPTTLTKLYVLSSGSLFVRSLSFSSTRLLALTRRSMRHCNLSSLSHPFLESFAALESLYDSCVRWTSCVLELLLTLVCVSGLVCRNLAANNLFSIYTQLPRSVEALHAMTEM